MTASTIGARGRRRANKRLPEHIGRAGVIVDAEHEFAGPHVDARAASDHLVKADRRMNVLEKHDVA
jgi:hypothetical protein